MDIGRLDVVFLSYDEPNADENFAHLSDCVPRAQRVHGIKGFDAAHRRVGEIARSDHVATIDGDNWIIDKDFFSGHLDVAPSDRSSVFSFRARNTSNGLEYGNGGVKIWPRSTLRTLRSHENTDRASGAVDFCWLVPYFQCDRVLSEVNTTATPYQAFRAGFREGVKLNLSRGQSAYDAYPSLPPLEALERHVGRSNVERLRMWCSVGKDVTNGDWGILGARLGCAMTALDGFEVQKISDFDWLEEFWLTNIRPQNSDPGTRARRIKALGKRLVSDIGLTIADLDPKASVFVKSVYAAKRQYGMMPW